MDFKFRIGDVVTTKVAIREAMENAKVHGKPFVPRFFMVIERRSQECPGGIQFHYALGEPDAQRRMLVINEIELALAEEFDAKATITAAECFRSEHTMLQ